MGFHGLILILRRVYTYGKFADIVRTVRAQVIRLKNDHKDVMLRIEKGLHALHQENREAEQQRTIQTRARVVETPPLIPFVLVNSVAESSPAHEAVTPSYEVSDSRVCNHTTRFSSLERVTHIITPNSRN